MATKAPGDQFIVESQEHSGNEIKIVGKKLRPSAKRIALERDGMTIIGARIFRVDKGKKTEISIDRINHLPTMNQVRLHSKETLFPGQFEVYLQLKS